MARGERMGTIEVINAQCYEVEDKMEEDRGKPAQFDRHIQIARGYPYMALYQEEILFTYDKRLDDGKLVFFASTDADQFIVKFTRRVFRGRTSHLADLGLAPRLRP